MKKNNPQTQKENRLKERRERGTNALNSGFELHQEENGRTAVHVRRLMPAERELTTDTATNQPTPLQENQPAKRGKTCQCQCRCVIGEKYSAPAATLALMQWKRTRVAPGSI
ncbi:hypothetical protein JOB18_030221 [Solea senegalensis]|uniref:Uncharacterized protein n=1 Tax=Solea senegalensis TaxID=28829 RepID=A0AAV6SMM1_SOLSE|nr:hypothetical protein JOB18_030221 [Solea senegalensis]